MSDSFDEAIARFGACGPEFGGGLSSHGPMAAEALVALGREDAVAAWSEWYAKKLAPPPRPVARIEPGGWQEALGDVRRAADWGEYFRRELERTPWQQALAVWAPRLARGIMAGGTHGLLRTAHAVRALDRRVTPERVRELGEGLAYWAACYQELPSAAPARGSLRVAEAIGRVALAQPPPGTGGLIFEQVRGVEQTDFAPVINLVDVDVAVDAFVLDVTSAFARVYAANARHASIAFVHTVTAPSALRFLAPHLDAAATRELMRYAWQACAAIYATYARAASAPPPAEAPDVDEADLVEQAVRVRDEHAIKFTEACLREYRRSGDGAFVAAARDAIVRVRARD